MAIFFYHGFIKGIPIELEEAAAIEGASRFRIFFQIVFPMLTPITATVAILNVLWIWNDFLLPLILLPKQSTIQLAQYGFFSLFKREYAKAMASLVLSASPVVIFYLLMQKFIIKGIASGSVKG
jgi:raffinose/stachyose/melibiose transport system permease protein